jgi:hypothetical protein
LNKEYRGGWLPNLRIGSRFQLVRRDVNVTINVVVAAGIDQMDLFAKSFAHDHDGVFSWMGHSRVGSGFDAMRFGSLLRSDPEYYSVTNDYQLIYWGGCNSYSYYSLPFFEFKSKRDPEGDPRGTRNLDIIANGLPSLFAFNAQNSAIALDAFLNWDRRMSFQEIVDSVENHARTYGVWVLNVVLGDEDNPVQ